jgi:hypothetical protein
VLASLLRPPASFCSLDMSLLTVCWSWPICCCCSCSCCSTSAALFSTLMVRCSAYTAALYAVVVELASAPDSICPVVASGGVMI